MQPNALPLFLLLLLPHPAAGWLAVAAWLLAAGLAGFGQGRLMPTLRAVPEADPAAARNSAGLHRWLGLAYLVPALTPLAWPWWWLPAVAVLARVVAFDVCLAWGETGRPGVAVGYTAASDRWLRRLAPVHPERLALGVKLLGLLGLLGLVGRG